MIEESKGNLSETIEDAVDLAKETVHKPLTIKLARFGFFTKGFLFIVIGVLAILVAVGIKSGELTAPSGALAAIAQVQFGRIILIIFIFGAIGHGFWNILRGAADVDNAGDDLQGIGKRIIPIGIGVFYIILAWTAFGLVLSAQSTAEDLQKTIIVILLALPLGAVLVGIVGLSVVGAGIHQCYAGISGKFKENLRVNEIDDQNLKIITVLGILGFTARALIFALIGYFFISAAFNFNPNIAVGMDGALLTLAQSYYGKTLLFITAAGLICHGILAFYEAKYRRIC